MPDTLTPAAAAPLLGLSEKRVQELCAASSFPGARKSQPGPRGDWTIPAGAVLAYRQRLLAGDVRTPGRYRQAPERLTCPCGAAETPAWTLENLQAGRCPGCF